MDGGTWGGALPRRGTAGPWPLAGRGQGHDGITHDAMEKRVAASGAVRLQEAFDGAPQSGLAGTGPGE